MSYVSPAVIKNFKEREEKVLALIKESGILYQMVGVFGSYARGEFKGGSDIDFCIVTNERPARSVSGSLREEADLLGADVIFVTEEYFQEDDTEFARNLRRDFICLDDRREMEAEYEAE